MITKPQYFFDFEIAFVFPIYFLTILFSFLSLKKGIIISINSVTLILIGLTFLFIQFIFGWWGVSPFHPDLNYGYWFSHTILLIMIVRSLSMIGKLKTYTINPKISLVFSVISILIPVLLVTSIIITYTKEKNAPIMRSEWEHREENRIVKEESWDYSVAFHAFANKYYSTDTLRKENFVLDSVRFTYFDDKSNIRKRFTRKAHNGELDVEAILEENY